MIQNQESAKTAKDANTFLKYVISILIISILTYYSYSFYHSAAFVADNTLKDCADCPEMVNIPANSFQMGSTDGDLNEQPVHMVEIEPFALSNTEVTFEHWDACVADGGCPHKPNDEGWGRGNRPVINVSWNDTQAFIKWINNKTSKNYRLPTESEWEYAARAGSTTKFSWGEELGINNANCDGCGSQWNEQTAPVKSFKKNAFDIYDMHGNVWEWVQDCWTDNYADDYSDCEEDSSRVIRGGSWAADESYMRSTDRERSAPSNRFDNTGFRLAKGLN